MGGEWRAIADPPPTAPRDSTVWAGDRVVVWGRHTSASPSTGLSYDPAADEWAPLPEAPISHNGASAVWTGTEVIFWGTHPAGAGPGDAAPAGAAYNPKERTWRVLPEAPISDRTDHQAVWTGDEMVVWGGLDTNSRPIESVMHASSAAAFDPVTNVWRKLRDVAPPWSGDGDPALTFTHEGDVFLYRHGRIASLDAGDDRWVPFGDPEPQAEGRSEATCPQQPYSVRSTMGALSDGELFIWAERCGRYTGHAISTESAEWRPLADAPLQGPAPTMTAGGRSLYAAADPGDAKVHVFRYDTAADDWEELEPIGIDIALSPALMWTGKELLVMNGYRVNDPQRPGAAFTPRRA